MSTYCILNVWYLDINYLLNSNNASFIQILEGAVQYILNEALYAATIPIANEPDKYFSRGYLSPENWAVIFLSISIYP